MSINKSLHISSITSFIAFFMLLLLQTTIKAQSFDFKTFDSSIGLPQNFVYCIEQDPNGYMWIGTGEGLVKYDGLKFTNYTRTDSLSEDFIRTLFVDKRGTLWVGHNNGSFTYKKDRFHKLQSEVEINSPINDICEDSAGNIWATVQNNGIVKITPDYKVIPFFNNNLFSGKLYYCIEAINPQTILVGTSDGLIRVNISDKGEVISVLEIEEAPFTKINNIVKRKATESDFWITTEDQGFYLYSYDQSTAQHIADNKLCLLFDIQNENIVDIYEEEEGHLLLATWGNGVIKLFYNAANNSYSKSLNFNTNNGLNNNFIKDILSDNEGNYWFATYGGGVSSLINDYFVFYKLDDIGFKQSKVYSVLGTQNALWMGLDNGILKTDPYCFINHEFYDAALGTPNDVITGFFQKEDGSVWIASENNGLYFREKDQLKFKKYFYTESLLGNKINDVEYQNGKIYLATSGGYYSIDTETKKTIHLTTERGLPHNYINFIHIDNNGLIWIGPKNSGICKIKDTEIEVHKLTQSPINVSDMTLDKQNNIWLSTIGKGVMKYSQDTLITYSVMEGLSKNYCYSIAADKNNKLWICHWPGLTSIDLNTNTFRNYGYENNISGDFYKVWKDNQDILWFASSEGVIKYFPDQDIVNSVAPLLNFTSVQISGEEFPVDKDIVLSYPYGRSKYKFRFNFTGISFKNPEAVNYQYRMVKDNDEDDAMWVDLGTTNFREYEFLPSGDYELEIKAFNADGVETLNPKRIKISIAKPFWQKIWFYTVVIALLLYSIYLFIKHRERKIIHQKQLLQKEVANQTVILRNQKAEIERKNRDITDSINYAKRIQSSILPPIQQLKQFLPESFIFYAPRDIVSGDFYWFNKSKNKFLICCADCTGHGVPGAFMSMIGGTLLNDIFKRKEVISPSDMLECLDEEIKILLQQKGTEHSQDGMDISIIEVDMSTNKVRLASAKRPVYLYINNELIIYNGSRRSIGDETYDENKTPFMNIEYNCNEGDLIYLFSDGYPDQFGGPSGKKLMKVGVKKLLDKIHELPMDEQHRVIESTFYKWKGKLEQVDDVIFMGIKI